MCFYESNQVYVLQWSVPKITYICQLCTNLNFCFLGDLFTALTTAWLKHDDFNIVSALEKTISTMQTVLKRTLSYAMSKSGGSDPSPGQLELKLIQSREDILNPKVEIKATRIV